MRSYEDLLVWQRGMALALEVHRLTRQGELKRDFGLRDQLTRASVSVPSNIAEGYERGGRREFARYLTIAKGSCGEVRTQLLLAKGAGYVAEDDARRTIGLATELSRMLAALRASVWKQRDHPDEG